MLVEPKLEGYIDEFSAQGFCVIPNALEPTELAAMRTAFDTDRLSEHSVPTCTGRCIHVEARRTARVVLLHCW